VKPKLLAILVGFLIASLLGASELISGGSEQTHFRNTKGLRVPSYLTNIPPEHFAGVSTPSNSLAEARKSAIGDAIRQILGSIGMKYNHHYLDEISGNVKNPQRVIYDKLSGNAQGIVLDVERSIVQSSWSKDPSGKYAYFVLVYYPEKKIQTMRRLSKGAKVIVSVLNDSPGGEVWLTVTELNSVTTIISSATITVHKTFRFAKMISLFMWKVPSESEIKTSIPIHPVKVCGNSAKLRFPIEMVQKNWKDYLLGTNLAVIIELSGYDELGRTVQAKMRF
jgi:hypothetical protein